jgi:hypothetical protein
VRTSVDDNINSAANISGELRGLCGQLEEKYFDYFTFNIIDYICINCGLLRSGARHQLALECGKSPQNLRFRRHQERDDPNSARGLDDNFASDRRYDSTTTTRLRHRRLRRTDYAAPIKAKFSASKKSIII